MFKGFSFIMKFVVLAIIYIVLFRIVKIMYLDLRGVKQKNASLEYALEVIDAPDTIGISKGSIYPIRSVTNIGRKDDNHIIINDPFVSGYHSRVYQKDGKIYVKDLNSTNGVRLNGEELEDTDEIFTGDIIEIGRILFKVIG